MVYENETLSQLLYVWKIKIKGQHHKIPFRAIKKSVLDGGDDRKTLIADSAHGAGGSYALQIQVKVPLQTPYSPKKGGSGGYEASPGNVKVPAAAHDPYASPSWLSPV